MSKPMEIRFSFLADRLIVITAYLVAIFCAWLAIGCLSGYELWLKIATGDFVATCIIFLFSLLFKNSSIYDPYWSIAPIIIFSYLILDNGINRINTRNILICITILYWGIRLTINWLRSWPGLNYQDWRYTKLANDTGTFFWPVSFLGIHLFPTLVVFLGCLPLIPITTSDCSLIWTDILGFSVSFLATDIERRSDNQLRKFKDDKNPLKGKVCNIGLWKYSRHPNYFGEIMFWAGLFIIAFGLNPFENMVYGIGFSAMVLLFIFISIPMMEKRQVKKEGYAEYQKRVSVLVPLPWKR